MVEVTVKFLAGVREDIGVSSTSISMPPDAVLGDLEPHLRALGIDPQANDVIITMNDRGFRHWPPDRCFVTGDVVMIFPHISGG